MSISLAGFGQPPTKKGLRQRGQALAAFLRSHEQPRNAQPISVEVGQHGRSATFGSRLLLNCEDGSSALVDLTDLPDSSAPLSVYQKGYFKLAAEDPVVTARIGGRFLTKRSLAGAFYLGARIRQHGLCEALVGFAALR